MPKKRYRPEEIIGKLREADVLIRQGVNRPASFTRIGVQPLPMSSSEIILGKQDLTIRRSGLELDVVNAPRRVIFQSRSAAEGYLDRLFAAGLHGGAVVAILCEVDDPEIYLRFGPGAGSQSVTYGEPALSEARRRGSILSRAFSFHGDVFLPVSPTFYPGFPGRCRAVQGEIP